MDYTPQYKMAFFSQGDTYSSFTEDERTVITDNQLYGISRYIGDGVLDGWSISYIGSNQIKVSTGSGFIGYTFAATIISKTATVVDNSENMIYVQSNVVPVSGPLNVETEGPRTVAVYSPYTDITPPSAPTTVSATSFGYSTVNLTWDANSEPDMHSYRIERSSSVTFSPFVVVGTTTTNGTDTVPFVDTVQGSYVDPVTILTYYYRIIAIDISGNESAPSSVDSISMPNDTHVPSNPSKAYLSSGNGTISLFFDKSPSSDITGYYVNIDELDASGSVVSTPYALQPLGLNRYFFANGLNNGKLHQVTIYAKNTPGNYSTGLIYNTTPTAVSSPLDITGLTATSLASKVLLSWTASASFGGSSVGQKSFYRIVVFNSFSPSKPIDIGLATTTMVSSYYPEGSTVLTSLIEGNEYFFWVSTVDNFGNESAGVFINSATLFVTTPQNPSNFSAETGTAQLSLTWTHSPTNGVIGYNIAYDTGSGFGADIQIGYVASYVLTGLPNDISINVRIKSRDSNLLLSSGVIISGTTESDTESPSLILNFNVSAKNMQANLVWSPSLDTDIDRYIVRRQAIAEPPWTNPTFEFMVLSEIEYDLGLNTEFVDVGLTNGQTYSYDIKSIDIWGNDSGYDTAVLCVPTPGVNDLSIAYNTSAVFSPSKITIKWTHDSINTTAYKIYRSTDPLVGFEEVGTVLAQSTVVPIEYTYEDMDYQVLKHGVTYYYSVSAAKDNCNIIVTQDSVIPANSILIGTVVMSSGTPTITNTQKIIAQFQGLAEDQYFRVKEHKHSSSPYNSIPIDSVSAVDLIDLATLQYIVLTDLSLSEASYEYYINLIVDPRTGESISYTSGQFFVPHPVAVVGNHPLVGDFQILVDAAIPTVDYSIDHDLNAVVFTTPLSSSVSVSMSGEGLSFYVPTVLNNGFRGYEIIAGTSSSLAMVDEIRQTIKFPEAITVTPTVLIEAPVPLFDAIETRRLNLSPENIINDFTSQDGFVYISENGGWSDSDSVVVLVGGEPTTIKATPSASGNSITFEDSVISQTVSLAILNSSEFQGLLQQENVSGIDGGAFLKGEFTENQLDLSHAGRIKEVMTPTSIPLTTTDYYRYSNGETVGSATTSYSFLGLEDGRSMTGTSQGLLRKLSISGELIPLGSSENVPSAYSTRPIMFGGMISTSDGIKAANLAAPYSGRFNGYVIVGAIRIRQPSIVLLSPTKALLSGGYVFNNTLNEYESSASCYIYNAGVWSATGAMSISRADHSLVLYSSNVLAIGGVTVSGDNVVCQSACESYDTTFETWSLTDGLIQPRSFASSVYVADDSSIIVSSGTTASSSGAPIITNRYISYAKESQVYSLTLTSTGDNPIVYTASSLPTGLSLVGDTISGTPTVNGSYSIFLTATNSVGMSTKTLILEVAPLASPIISSSLSITSAVGMPFEYEIVSNGNPNSFTATGLPSEIVIFGNKIFGSSFYSGVFSPTIGVSDEWAGADSQSLSITVYDGLQGQRIAGLESGGIGVPLNGQSAVNSLLGNPKGIDKDSLGNIYFADSKNNAVRKIASGIVTTIIGTGIAGNTGDGGFGTAATICPEYVKLDPAESNLYVSDRRHGVVRVFNLGTGIITKVAGTGTPGLSLGDGAAAIAATICPNDIFVTATDLYICDYYEASSVSSSNKVRVVNFGSGNISTFAGTGTRGFSGDGGLATAAELSEPRYITKSGTDFYISDFGNARIRKVDSLGNISTVVGNGTRDDQGVSGNATSLPCNPGALSVDGIGDLLYVSNGNMSYLRRLQSSVSTAVARFENLISGLSRDGRVASFQLGNQIYSLSLLSGSLTGAPAITAISPNSCYEGGNKRIDIYGAGFDSNCKIYFGEIRLVAGNINFIDSTHLTSVVPVIPLEYLSGSGPGSAGVVVVNSSGLSAIFTPALSVSENQIPEDTVILSSEKYDTATSKWQLIPSCNSKGVNSSSKVDGKEVITVSTYTGVPVSDLFDTSLSTWTLVTSKYYGVDTSSVSDPIKQIVLDIDDETVYLVQQSSVLQTTDFGENISEIKGTEDAEVVHAMIVDSSGNLFCATDVGVYFLSSADKATEDWTQCSLIGDKTSETFDLCEYDGKVFVVTESGIFYTTNNGSTWIQSAEIANCFQIEYAGGTTLYVSTDQAIHRTDDNWTTWTTVSLNTLDKNTKLLARQDVDLFVGTATGLYRSSNGTQFELVNFKRNKDTTKNSVYMLALYGTDVFVGYDNEIYSIDPSLGVDLINQSNGIIPTVKLNDIEKKTGFFYDVVNKKVVFENKLSEADAVAIVPEYQLYSSSAGGWYDVQPNAPYQIYVNGYEYNEQDVMVDPRTGRVSFPNNTLNKYDTVQISIFNITILDSGEHLHEEIESILEMEKGGINLPLDVNYSANILQLGTSIEHNFLERGLLRNSYEGTEGFEDRSFNSFLRNSKFFIVGRKDYDVFNSTIDYKEQSSSKDIGTRGLVPLCSYELSSTELWIGTEDGIVVLNPSSGFEVSNIIQVGKEGNRIRDIYLFSDFILIVSSYGLYKTSDYGVTFEKIDTTNLPTVLYSAKSFGSTIFVSTEEGIYYSTDRYGDPIYGAWTKCSFKTYAGESIQVVSPCYSIASSSGRFAAVCGRNIFSSTDGIEWVREYEFSSTEGATVFKSVFFAERLYMATNKGIYTDGGTLPSSLVVVSPVVFYGSLATSQSIGINSLWASSSLYAVGNQPRVYILQNQTWDGEDLNDVDTAHLVTTVLSDTIRVVISNNIVFTG